MEARGKLLINSVNVLAAESPMASRRLSGFGQVAVEAGAAGTSTSTGPSRGATYVLPISCCIHSQAMPGLQALRDVCVLDMGISSELSPDKPHLAWPD